MLLLALVFIYFILWLCEFTDTYLLYLCIFLHSHSRPVRACTRLRHCILFCCCSINDSIVDSVWSGNIYTHFRVRNVFQLVLDQCYNISFMLPLREGSICLRLFCVDTPLCMHIRQYFPLNGWKVEFVTPPWQVAIPIGSFVKRWRKI